MLYVRGLFLRSTFAATAPRSAVAELGVVRPQQHDLPLTMEHNEDNFLGRLTPASAIIGPDGREVSMQIVQAVYNDLTGRTEEISKFSEQPFIAGFDDLRDLNTRIQQLYEQYHITSKNCTVTVYYSKEAKDTFSSFDRFLAFDTSSTRTVSNLHIKYEFLIILPEARRPQAYTLSVQLVSGIAATASARENLPQGLPPFVTIMRGPTARISIEYVDYVVARTFVDAIGSWVEGLPDCDLPSWLGFFVRNSEWVRRFTQFALISSALYACSIAIPRLIPTDSSALPMLAKTQLWALAFLYFATFLGRLLGSRTEHLLDTLQTSSALKLTRGDQKLLEATKCKRKDNLALAIASIVLTFIIGFLASMLANMLTLPKP